jgi:hypothetical protein
MAQGKSPFDLFGAIKGFINSLRVRVKKWYSYSFYLLLLLKKEIHGSLERLENELVKMKEDNAKSVVQMRQELGVAEVKLRQQVCQPNIASVVNFN